MCSSPLVHACWRELVRRADVALHAFRIRQVGFWTTLVGESNHDLTYMLAWESLAEREQKWTAFMFDPEWIAKRAETETSGPIVQTLSNQLLMPTGFSASR